MARVFQGQKTFLHPLLRPVERLVYWAGGVNEQAEMTWKGYFLAVLVFNVVGILSLWGLLMSQKWLPLNPQHFDNVPWALALNTAISFITNTNWQAYSGENTMSYLSQMAGLAVHNFLSAATGIAVHFGEDDAGEREAGVKILGGVDGVLAGHGVGDEEDLLRAEKLFEALHFGHQVFVDVEAAGGVDDQRVAAHDDGFAAGFFREALDER